MWKSVEKRRQDWYQLGRESETQDFGPCFCPCVRTYARVCIGPDALNDCSPNESTNDPSVSCEGLSDERGPTGRPRTTERWGTTLEHVPTGCECTAMSTDSIWSLCFNSPQTGAGFVFCLTRDK